MTKMQKSMRLLVDHPIKYFAVMFCATAAISFFSPPLDSREPATVSLMVGALLVCLGWLVFPLAIVPTYFVRAWRARNLFQHKSAYLVWLLVELAFFVGLITLALVGLLSGR